MKGHEPPDEEHIYTKQFYSLELLHTEVEKDMNLQTKNTSTLNNFTHLSSLMLKWKRT